MTGLPGGLAEAIASQLERQIGQRRGGGRSAAPAAGGRRRAAGAVCRAAARAARRSTSCALAPGRRACRRAPSGIPAAFMVAQAAHESGWGRREIKQRRRRPSHNLFGIKAGAGWKGPVAEVTTTEYDQRRAAEGHGASSAPTRRYAESFPDYAKLMKEQPALPGVVAQAASARRAPRPRKASRRACSAPAMPPTPPTPTSSRA